jgi:branched-chain amino acid transport system substrate-binding protein
VLAALESLNSKVEGVVTVYDKPFSKTDHEAITSNIPLMGEVKGGRVGYANPEEQKTAGQVRVKKAQ